MGLVALTLLVWVPLLRWNLDYGKALRFEGQISSLGRAMESFYSSNGRNATSLLEVVQFSSETQFLSLARYHPQFVPHGTNTIIFSMMVNDVGGWTISTHYEARMTYEAQMSWLSPKR